MPGRKYSAGSGYRYGYNGQEVSEEIGEGLTTAEFWEYDSRIGRRWNIDPIEKVFESPYLCFSDNPIGLSDVLGNTASHENDPPNKSPNSDQKMTLPHLNPKGELIGGLPGEDMCNNNRKRLKIPASATGFTLYDNESNYKVNGKSVNANAGDIRSITVGGSEYSARWNSDDLTFAGYYNKNNERLGIETTEHSTFSEYISIANYVNHWGSPIQNTDTYLSLQIKDDQSLPGISNKYIESSKFTWTLAGVQVGYNTDNGGGWYAQAGSLNNSYLNLNFLPSGNSSRFMPATGPLASAGNTKGSGDFNLAGRTIITVTKFSGVDFQLDFNYAPNKVTAGFRTKAEVPLWGNTKFEAAAGARFQWAWPRALQNGWPSIFGQVRN